MFVCIENLLDRPLHPFVRVLFVERPVPANISGRKGFVQFTSSGFLSTTLLHPLRDHRQLVFIERTLDAEQDSILGNCTIIDAMLIGQQNASQSAETHQLISVLIVSHKSRQLPSSDDADLIGQNRFEHPLVVFTSVLTASGIPRVAPKDDDSFVEPAQFLNQIPHASLSLFSLSVSFDLGQAALPQIYECLPLKMPWSNRLSVHGFAPRS
jgi:hypothetical protein